MTSHFKDQIDKLTAIITSAVGKKNTVAKLSEPSTQPAKIQNRRDVEYVQLGAMILKMQDGLLEERYISRLGKWLSCDEKALRYYVEFTQLSEMLRLLYSKKQNKTEELFFARN